MRKTFFVIIYLLILLALFVGKKFFLSSIYNNAYLGDSNIIGDVNGDDKVNSLDYILIRKHILNISALSTEQQKKADVNGDTKINTMDYIAIRKSILYNTPISPTIEQQTINVNELALNKAALTLEVGKAETLIATITPSNATNKMITWTSSDPTVATVDKNGKVTGVKVGSARITASTSNGKSAMCTVTIKSNIAVAVTEISLNERIIRLYKGKSETLTATITPSNATDKTVTWTSSDSTIATVDKNGKVTGVKVGNATITAITKDGKKKATCLVNVDTISLPESSLSIAINEQKYLNLINRNKEEIVWTSSNPSVATVSPFVDSKGKTTGDVGVVLGKKEGRATIIASTKDGNNKAMCEIIIGEHKVTGITLDKTSLTQKIGESNIILASVSPSNASNKEITWTSNNPNVATVSVTNENNRARVESKAIGVATITATTKDGNKVATCNVTVISSYITLNKTKITLLKGSSEKLVPIINSSYVYDKTIKWESSSTHIATVSSDGVVTGVSPSSVMARISAKLGNSGGYAYCDVEVLPASGWSEGGSYHTRQEYYYGSNGEMYVNRWLQDGSKWYYFGSDGHPYCSVFDVNIDGSRYSFDGFCVCTNR